MRANGRRTPARLPGAQRPAVTAPGHARVWGGGCAHGAPPCGCGSSSPKVRARKPGRGVGLHPHGTEPRAQGPPALGSHLTAPSGSPFPGTMPGDTRHRPRVRTACGSSEPAPPSVLAPGPPVGRDALLQRRARSWGWAWGVRWRSSAPPHTAPQTSSLLRAEMTPGAGLSAACRDQSGEARPRASPSARPRPK